MALSSFGLLSKLMCSKGSQLYPGIRIRSRHHYSACERTKLGKHPVQIQTLHTPSPELWPATMSNVPRTIKHQCDERQCAQVWHQCYSIAYVRIPGCAPQLSNNSLNIPHLQAGWITAVDSFSFSSPVKSNLYSSTKLSWCFRKLVIRFSVLTTSWSHLTTNLFNLSSKHIFCSRKQSAKYFRQKQGRVEHLGQHVSLKIVL